MPRRVNLPGASELFRTTRPGAETPTSPGSASPAPPAGPPRLQPSGRVRHDEKITVYVSSDELLALEQARIRLRAEHRLAVDRGRIVRAAITAALADLDQRGPDSDLVRRLGDT